MLYELLFIVMYYVCVYRLYEGKGQQTFEMSMYEMLKLVSNLMCNSSDSTILFQGACLKYVPHSIPDIMTVFSVTQLRYKMSVINEKMLYFSFLFLVHC